MAVPLSYNLRNILVRRFSTSSAALGIGLVVAIFILVLALASGFSHAVRTAGSPLNAMVLRKGSNAEISSAVTLEEATSISVRPEIALDEGGIPLLVKDLVVLVVLPRRVDGAPAQVVVRGTQEAAFRIHENLRLAAGRTFRPGLPELVVGRALSGRVSGLDLGTTLRMQGKDWKVVGVFETGGTGFESEIWGDANVLLPAFKREGFYQSVTFRMANPRGFDRMKEEWERDPKYQVEVKTEASYYEDQAGTLTTFIRILGTLITVVMSIGAMFGAMNTMYAAVGSRSREIATLRALGFRRREILASFLLESLAISAAGGALGCLLALPINGVTTSTINWDTFSELAFAFRVTPAILAWGFAFALVMGAAGGLLPALRAARTPIVAALRQV